MYISSISYLISDWRYLIGLQEHIPKDAEEEIVVGVGEVIDELLLVGLDGLPRLVLILDLLLQQGLVLFGAGILLKREI